MRTALVAAPPVFGAILISAWLLSLPDGRLVLFFPDDAFFYLKTADHIRQGLGSTFDGLNPTNGYHPLYLLLLVGLSHVMPIQGYAGLRGVVVLDTLLLVTWLVLVAAVARRLEFSRGWAMAIAVACLPVAFIADYGMESNLVLPVAWALILAAIDLRSRRQALWFGAVGVALVMTRLDGVLFLGALTAAHLWLQRHRSLKPQFAIASLMVAPAVVALLCFVSWNTYAYGHPGTVSSALKFGTPAVSRLIENLFVVMPMRERVPFLGVLAVSVAAFVYGIWRQTPRNVLLAAIAFWQVGYVILLLLSLRGGIELWYHVLPLSLLPLLAVTIMSDMVRSPRLALTLASGIMIAALSFTLVEVRYWLSRWWLIDDARRMGEWISAELPLSGRVYQVDHSGVVAYFAKRPVINGDGLINSWAYQDVVRDGAIPGYLTAHGVEYIVWDDYADETTIEIPLPRWRLPPLTLRLGQPEQVVRFGRVLLLRIDPSRIAVAK